MEIRAPNEIIVGICKENNLPCRRGSFEKSNTWYDMTRVKAYRSVSAKDYQHFCSVSFYQLILRELLLLAINFVDLPNIKSMYVHLLLE